MIEANLKILNLQLDFVLVPSKDWNQKNTEQFYHPRNSLVWAHLVMEATYLFLYLTHNHWSVCLPYSFAFSRISYKWSSTICSFWYSFFHLRNHFKVHLCYLLNQWFILFYYWVIFHCLDVWLFILLPVEGHLLCFQIGVIMNKYINICVQVFVWK